MPSLLNPYPSPPPVPHNVWILDCSSCGAFLTNRAMKAVLLLRPTVSLYSSDALPINCSAYSSNPDVLRSRASCPRTCECLTQTLCCHGCGTTVGYMIVIPCSRCTSSITATNRATNGHRFVFHSSEVVSSERHYIMDEPGVIPCTSTTVAMSPSMTAPQPYFHPPPYTGPRDPHFSYSQPHLDLRPSYSPQSEYLPTPPLEFADITFASHSFAPSENYSFHHGQRLAEFHSLSRAPHPLIPHIHPHSPSAFTASQAPQYITSPPISADSSYSSPSSSPPQIYPSPPFGMPAEQKEQSTPCTLKAGDILFWHHLARNGEIPGVTEDMRARKKSLALPSARMAFNR